MKNETLKDVLIRLAKENTSTGIDCDIISNLLRNTLDYKACFITSGIVYLDGRGTIQNPPQSIHSIARMICKVLKIKTV